MEKILRDNMNRVDGFFPTYMPREFVKAHEDVHRKLASASVKIRYAELVGQINNISLPCNDFPDAQLARAAMQSSIDEAQRRFQVRFDKDEKKNAAHIPKTAFINAQKAVSYPYIKKVLQEMLKKRCFE